MTITHLEPQALQNDQELDQVWADVASADSVVARRARDLVVTRYAPLVTHIASRMIVRLPDSVEIGDLVSYGMFGLIDAVSKYEHERGLRFETYAATRIRGAILDELRASDWVPRSVRAKARSLETTTRELEQQAMGSVDDAAIASALEWSESEVRNVRAQVALSHISALEGMVGVDGDFTSLDAIRSIATPDAAAPLEQQERQILLAGALQSVREREQQVLQYYYFENLTLAQIGAILGVTESRVSQIHSAAVGKMREALLRTGAFVD